jgi:transcription termination factor NusB
MLFNDLKKEAQIMEKNPVYVAETLEKIIKVMVDRISVEKRPSSLENIKNKILDFNALEMSQKKSPGGAAIGASLGLIKNILNSKDPYFINIVISELAKRL